MKILKFVISFFMLFVYSFANCQVSTIKFGVLNFYPPFVSTNEQGQVYGFDIEIAQSLCKQLTAVCTFTRMPLVDLFKALQNNQVDAIISGIYVTPERKKFFNFTDPYYRSTMSFVGLSSSNFPIDSYGLKNKTVGVLSASIFPDYIKKQYAGIPTIKTFINTNDIFGALAKGDIDLVMVDTATANYWVQHSKNVFKFMGNPIYMPADEGYSIAVGANNIELVNKLNDALKTMKSSGELQMLIQKYFSL